MKTECPINKTECPCPEYSKEGLCDYPYKTQNDLVFISQKGFIDVEKEYEQWQERSKSLANIETLQRLKSSERTMENPDDRGTNG